MLCACFPLKVGLRGLQAKLAGIDNATIKAFKTATAVRGLAALKIGFFQRRSVNEFLWGYKDLALARAFQLDGKRIYALQVSSLAQFLKYEI